MHSNSIRTSADVPVLEVRVSKHSTVPLNTASMADDMLYPDFSARDSYIFITMSSASFLKSISFFCAGEGACWSKRRDTLVSTATECYMEQCVFFVTLNVAMDVGSMMTFTLPKLEVTCRRRSFCLRDNYIGKVEFQLEVQYTPWHIAGTNLILL